VGEKSRPKEKKCVGWRLQSQLVGASYRKAWHDLAQPGRGRNRTENRRNTEMQKHKKTKRTHFDNTIRYAYAILNSELRSKNSELFAKRTHFPPFSTKNAHSQNEPIFEKIPDSINLQSAISNIQLQNEPIFPLFQPKTHIRKTNPFGVEHWRPVYLSILNCQLSISPHRGDKTNPFSVLTSCAKWAIFDAL
jgi:hypothetical protein